MRFLRRRALVCDAKLGGLGARAAAEAGSMPCRPGISWSVAVVSFSVLSAWTFFSLPRGLSLSPWTHPEDGEGREALLLAVKISRRGAFYRGEWTKDAASRQAEKNLCNSRVNSAAPRRLQQFINIVLHSSTLYIRRVKFKYK